jgi:hypothetical protein
MTSTKRSKVSAHHGDKHHMASEYGVLNGLTVAGYANEHSTQRTQMKLIYRKLLTGWKFSVSFVKRDWILEDYPDVIDIQLGP